MLESEALGVGTGSEEDIRCEIEETRTGLGPFIKRVNIERPLRGRLELA